MNYPAEQFEVLTKIITQINEHLGNKFINSFHPSNLHYLVFQQLSEGQRHNALYYNSENKLVNFWGLSEAEKLIAKKFITIEYEFLLYPDNCKDTHIETAVKKIVKSLSN